MRRLAALVDEAGEPPREDFVHRSEVVGGIGHAADPEAPVVGLLRRPAFEDDHRCDRVLGPDVGDVVALDPDRRLIHPDRLGELGERLGSLATLAFPAELVLGERQLRVPLGELAKLALVAALGRSDLDPVPRRRRAPPRGAPSSRRAPGRRRRAAARSGTPRSTGR